MPDDTLVAESLDEKIEKELTAEFGSKSDNEIADGINETWNISECQGCGKQIDLMVAVFIEGDPYCARCGRC